MRRGPEPESVRKSTFVILSEAKNPAGASMRLTAAEREVDSSLRSE
jgi:hypothetical protein